MAKHFLTIFLPLLVLVWGAIYALFYTENKADRANLETHDAYDLLLHKETLVNDVKSVLSDVLIIAALQEVATLFKDIEGTKEGELRDLSHIFRNFSKRKGVYDQIRLLDDTGMEVIRVNFYGGSPYAVPKDQLQFKGDRYYFKETSKLRQGDVYVSPLDLNIERGEIEQPLKPTIRFGTPVYDIRGNKRGVIVLNYFGEKLFRDFDVKRTDTHDHHDILLNSDGFWLIGMKPEDEWGFMYEDKKGRTFGNTFPEAWQQVLNEESGQFYNEDGLFTFTTVYPLLEVSKASPGMGKTFEPHFIPTYPEAKAYYWKGVTYIPSNSLKAANLKLLSKYSLVFAIMVVILGGVSYVIARTRVSRRRAEEAHRESEERMCSVMETASDAIIVMDNDVNILFWNNAAERIFGYTATEAIGANMPSLIVPQKYCDTFAKGFARFRETGQGPLVGKTVEMTARRKDGPEFPMEHSISSVKVKGRWCAVGIIRDITKRKHMTDQIEKSLKEKEVLLRSLKQANTQLEQSFTELKLKQQQLIQSEKMASLGQLAARVAHEIKNPLSSISLNLELLQDELKDCGGVTTKEAINIIESITAEVDRLTGLSEEYLQFARIPNIPLKTVSINDVLLKLAGFLREEISKDNIILTEDYEEGLSPVAIDENQMKQALLNIFKNAFEAMPKGGKLCVQTGQGQNGTVDINITDTGMGINKERLEKIFEPFYTTKNMGTGLGLTVSQQIIREHGGEIYCQSTLGKGTNFTIQLPLAR